jgi:hypothetical protein
MLEKSSCLVLTDDDISQYHAGIVSDRLQQTWGLSFEQLQEIIESKQFTKVKVINEP